MDKRSQKYFSLYAEPGLFDLATGIHDTMPLCDVAVVVPLREEPQPALAKLLQSLKESAGEYGLRLLTILVVNGREDDAMSVHANNAATLGWLDQNGARQVRKDAFLRLEPHGATFILDRASPGLRLPPRQGVGLARKLGNDLAAVFIKIGLVRHPVFGNTDGDACVPQDYLDRLRSLNPDEAGAWIYPFRHISGGDDHIDEQTLLYERYLLYYAQHLKAAGSPYGFVSLGSVICMDVERYIAVRGHPKRLAGEDFYILNKIKKIAPVISLDGAPITLTARISDRVPFGTGQAVAVMTQRHAHEPYLVYDPRSFQALEAFLSRCEEAVRSGDPEPPAAIFTKWMSDETERNLRSMLGLDHFWPKIDHADPKERHRRFHDIFDGLRTLQLIHHLRDLVWPPVAIELAVPSKD